MKEYNAIEKATKGNKTWLKNPDGSEFKGTPEQFVQQQSNNFKKAFGESKLLNPDGSPTIQYHGTSKKFDTFDPKMFQTGDSGYSGLGIYTSPNKVGAESYALSSAKNHTGEIKPTVMELYGLGKNPIRTHELPEGSDLFNFHRPTNWAGDVPIKQQLLDHDVAIRTQRGGTLINSDHKSYENVFPTNTQLKSSTGNRGTFDMSNPNIYYDKGGPVEDPTDIQKRMVGEKGYINEHRFDPERSWSYDEDGNKVPSIYHAPKQEPFTITAEGTKSTKDRKQFEKDTPFDKEAYYRMGGRDQWHAVNDWETSRDDYVVDEMFKRNPRGDKEMSEWMGSFTPDEQKYLSKRNMNAGHYGTNKWDTGWSAEGQPWYKQTAAGALNLLTTPVGAVTGAIDPNMSALEGAAGVEGIMSRDEDTDMAMRMGLDPLMYTGTGLLSRGVKGVSSIVSKGAKAINKALPKAKIPYIEGIVDDAGKFHPGKYDVELGVGEINGQRVLVDGKPITNWQYAVNRQAELLQDVNKLRTEYGLNKQGVSNRLNTIKELALPPGSQGSKAKVAQALHDISRKLSIKTNLEGGLAWKTGLKIDGAMAIGKNIAKRFNPAYQKKANAALKEGNDWFKGWINSPGFEKRLIDYLHRTKAGETLTPKAFETMVEMSKKTKKGPNQFQELDKQMFGYFPKKSSHSKSEYDSLIEDFLIDDLNKLVELGKSVTTGEARGRKLATTFTPKGDRVYDLITGKRSGIGNSLGVRKSISGREGKLAEWFNMLGNQERSLVQKYIKFDNITSIGIHETTHLFTKGDRGITAAMYNDLVSGFGQSSEYVRSIGETIERTKEWSKYVDDFTKIGGIRGGKVGEKELMPLIQDLVGTSQAGKEGILRQTWDRFRWIVENNPTKNAVEGGEYHAKVQRAINKSWKRLNKLRPQNKAERFAKFKGNSKEAIKARQDFVKDSEKFLESMTTSMEKVFDEKHGLRYLNDPTELMARMNELRRAMGIKKGGEKLTSRQFYDRYKNWASVKSFSKSNAKGKSINEGFINMVSNQIEDGVKYTTK